MGQIFLIFPLDFQRKNQEISHFSEKNTRFSYVFPYVFLYVCLCLPMFSYVFPAKNHRSQPIQVYRLDEPRRAPWLFDFSKRVRWGPAVWKSLEHRAIASRIQLECLNSLVWHPKPPPKRTTSWNPKATATKNFFQVGTQGKMKIIRENPVESRGPSPGCQVVLVLNVFGHIFWWAKSATWYELLVCIISLC